MISVVPDKFPHGCLTRWAEQGSAFAQQCADGRKISGRITPGQRVGVFYRQDYRSIVSAVPTLRISPLGKPCTEEGQHDRPVQTPGPAVIAPIPVISPSWILRLPPLLQELTNFWQHMG